MKQKILDIFIKGLEKHCLTSNFPKTLLLAGVGLISVNKFDLFLMFFNMNEPSQYFQNFVGGLLIILSIFIYVTERNKNKQIDSHSHTALGVNLGVWSCRRKIDIYIASRVNILMMLIGILLLIMVTCLFILNYGDFGILYLWVCLFILVFFITPISFLIRHIFYIKDNKLLILNKKYNIEYSKDGNVYLTSYEFLCGSCPAPTEGYLTWGNGNYQVVCNEYQNQHKQVLQISQFDKFTNP